MSLANLLKKGSLRGAANAIPANVAKDAPDTPPSLARLATLALANTPTPAANDPAIQVQAGKQNPARNEVRTGLVRSESAPVDQYARARDPEFMESITRGQGDWHPDRWAWPHSTAMTGAEIDTFTARLARFTDKGLTTDDGEALADKLVTRDRESDDRRLCLECTHLAGHAGSWRCNNWQRADVAIKARDAGLPRDLVQLLQQCDGFKGVTT